MRYVQWNWIASREGESNYLDASDTSEGFIASFRQSSVLSEGEKTEYIMVQYDQDGTVHGYPVTVNYLRSRGAAIR